MDKTPEELAHELEEFEQAVVEGRIDDPACDPADVAEVGHYG